ncbi:PREDICTED: protein JTB isoform X1 [Galeopterus variegatus]|uniref:Protein JTB isoform X1 n=2 Tax=Galeopterus variegatus TaxID=482537 RepID=A0ABM0QBS9_GALVR|nr:PREDICTED: protein JTB isoform X1 [Galeopterus variegatus]
MPHWLFLQDLAGSAEAPCFPVQQMHISFSRCGHRCDTERSMFAGAGRLGLPQSRRLCWLLCAFTLKLCQAEVPVREEKLSVSTSNLPCWLVEEFVVAEECAPCSNFQAKTTPECSSTGYVEKITCSSSKRNDFKSCRSALMEQYLFWKFEGAVVGVALIFACLVIIRQRQLDRKALEKVRKQIESI